MAADPRIRLNAGRTFPLRRATVQGETAFDRRLQEPKDIAATAALATIQTGLGAYLESIGFIAEHPLLYVDVSNDPYVYVRFDVSHDGLGFLDTTFVYSPGVADLLNEIFDAYGVNTADECAQPHTSQTMLDGRPVHAAVEALTTCRRESEIDWYDHYSSVQGDRQPKTWRRKMRIRCAARRRRRRGPNFAKPSFDFLWHDDPRRSWRPPFSELPLNWALTSLTDEEPENINWRADEDGQTAAAKASVAIWRRYVEPRLVHASRDRGRGKYFQTWMSSIEGGDGILGDEWDMYDLLYWSVKGQYQNKYYWESAEYYTLLSNASDNLYNEYVFISRRLSRAVEKWVQNAVPDRNFIDEDSKNALFMQALEQTSIVDAASLFSRQQAILAYLTDVKPEPGWRRKISGEYIFASKHPDEIIRYTLFRSL